jgi:hypothetical protein
MASRLTYCEALLPHLPGGTAEDHVKTEGAA